MFGGADDYRREMLCQKGQILAHLYDCINSIDKMTQGKFVNNYIVN